MTKINLKYCGNDPQYVCSSCSSCSSLLGKSLCSVKNRGCCWYFPKFTLFEIHKMVKSQDGLNVLKKILKLPKVKIYNYYIQARGFFDEKSYKAFARTSSAKTYKVQDRSIFFRACPFVKQGAGCTIPAEYRSFVCNLFICEEVIDKLNVNNELDIYIKERENYSRWIDWENNSIQAMLEEKHIDLVDNFDEVIDVLKSMPLESYEFPKLNDISVDEILNITA